MEKYVRGEKRRETRKYMLHVKYKYNYGKSSKRSMRSN